MDRKAAPATVLLAHGAGAPMDSPFMAAIAGGLGQRGWRVASLLVDELAASDGVRGCICLGYPFHPPGKPLQLRTEHLITLQTPTVVLQGERDTFGRREDVESYSLSPQLQLRWIPSGEHSFQPTRSSGFSEAENWSMAVALSDSFLQERMLDAAMKAKAGERNGNCGEGKGQRSGNPRRINSTTSMERRMTHGGRTNLPQDGRTVRQQQSSQQRVMP